MADETLTPSPYYPPPGLLDALQTAWQQGTAPSGIRLVVLLGPEGVGKTALLTQFAAALRARRPAVTVLSEQWSAEEFDPFAPFLSAFGLTYVLGRLVPGVPRKAMHWAVTLTMSQMQAVPILGLIPGVLSSILEEEVQGLLDQQPVVSDGATLARLRQQLADAIARRARHQPLALILEDLQHAEDVGLELLDFLVEALATTPVVFFVSLRTTAEQPATVPAAISSHLRLGSRYTQTVVVPPLDPATTRQFLEAQLTPHFPPATIRAILDESVAAVDGVPRRILRLTERLAKLSHLTLAGLHEVVREFALNNLNLLNEKELEIVQLAAVLGTPVPEAAYPLVGTTHYWGLSERDIRKYLPKLGNFLTPALYEAMYTSLDPALRQVDHLRCAQLLERAYGDTMPLALLPVVAQHYAAAGQAAQAGRFYLQAGLALTEQNLNTPAQAQLAHARALLGESDDPATLAGIDYLLGWTHYKLGDFTPAKQALQQAVAGYDQASARLPDAPSKEAQARRDRAELLLGLVLAVGEQRYDQAVPSLQAVSSSPDDRVRALAQITLGYCLYRAQPEEAERLIRTGLAAARELANPFTIAQALQYLAILLMNRGDAGLLAEAITHLREAANYAEADKYLLGQIYTTLGDAYARGGDDEQAIGYLQQSLALKEETGDRIGQAFAYGALGRAYQRTGRLDEALVSFQQDLAIIRPMAGQEGPRIQLHCEIAEVQRLRGDGAAALGEISRASAVIAALPAGPFRQRQEAFRDLAGSQVAQALGRPRQALIGVRQARAAFAALGFQFIQAYCDLVEGGILRELGDLPAAAACLERAAAGQLEPYEAAWLAWEQARLAQAQGDRPAAATYQAQAQDRARRLRNAWLEQRFTPVETSAP